MHFYILTNYHKDKLRKTIYLQTLHKYKIPKNISNQRGEKTCTWKSMILMKETEDTNKCKDNHVHQLEELIMLKCSYYSKSYIESIYKNYNGIFQSRKNNPKIYMKP